MKFIPQCKGTDSDTIHNLQRAWNEGARWYASTKYDGQYAQIHIKNGECLFYTSSGKPYTNEILSKILLNTFKHNMILEAEYLGTGDGKMGGRAAAAVVTTARTAYAKGIGYGASHSLRIFDIIENQTFADRLDALDDMRSVLQAKNELIKVVDYNEVMCLNDVYDMLNYKLKDGWEGLYVKSVWHNQLAGKRVKLALKFKAKQTATLTIIDIDEGTGKYEGKIGAFICEDEGGMRVNVGSGLTDSIRNLEYKYVIGKKIRINYERIDTTYIFPIFIDFV